MVESEILADVKLCCISQLFFGTGTRMYQSLPNHRWQHQEELDIFTLPSQNDLIMLMWTGQDTNY